MRHHQEVIALALCACTTAPPAHAPAPPPPDVTYTLSRATDGVDVSVETVSITDDTTFSIDAWAGVEHPETAISQVEGSGPVAHPDAHTWTVHGHGRVSLRYHLASSAVNPDNRYHPLATTHFVHLIGNTALLAPTMTGDRHVHVDWRGFDGWTFATSHGTGASVDYTGAIDRFRDAVFYAADDLRITTRKVGSGDVVLAAAGAWSFPDASLADRIAAIIAMERAFFVDQGPPRFVVTLLQLGEQGSYGGTGLTTSFALEMAKDTAFGSTIDELLAHEHFHNWNGRVIEPDGDETQAYWFSEGFTEFYTPRLLYRAGMLTLEEYVDSLDEEILAYTASSAREMPNDKIGAGFWKSHEVEKIPYQRGSLVALVVDHAIRKRGTRSLDDVMRDLAAAGRKGEQVTTDKLLARFGAETSDALAATLRATVVDGATLAIDADLLEPCLTGEVGEHPTFELGFDPASLRDSHVVHGVVPGSAAERAGLRDGDKLDGIDVTFGQAERPAKFWVGKREIEYLPQKMMRVLAFRVHDAAACPAVLGGPVGVGAHQP